MTDSNEKTQKIEQTIDEKLDKAIGHLIDQAKPGLKPPEALQQSQAILNIAHAKQIFWNIEYNKSQNSEGKTPKKQGPNA